MKISEYKRGFADGTIKQIEITKELLETQKKEILERIETFSKEHSDKGNSIHPSDLNKLIKSLSGNSMTKENQEVCEICNDIEENHGRHNHHSHKFKPKKANHSENSSRACNVLANEGSGISNDTPSHTLRDKRNEWFEKWCRKPVNARCLIELKEQDKELQEELKEIIDFSFSGMPNNAKLLKLEINKLFLKHIGKVGGFKE